MSVFVCVLHVEVLPYFDKCVYGFIVEYRYQSVYKYYIIYLLIVVLLNCIIKLPIVCGVRCFFQVEENMDWFQAKTTIY